MHACISFLFVVPNVTRALQQIPCQFGYLTEKTYFRVTRYQSLVKAALFLYGVLVSYYKMYMGSI